MKRYCITDSLDVVALAAGRGVDMIQIRAKDLAARDLFRLARRAVELAGESLVLINTRFDVALAAGAQGVHLTSRAVAPSWIRRVAPKPFVIGVSCHNLEEIRRAEDEGANFVVFGPVFPTPSKPGAAPVGLEALRDVCLRTTIPVYALGGITEVNAPSCLEAGAAGIAGISLFRT